MDKLLHTNFLFNFCELIETEQLEGYLVKFVEATLCKQVLQTKTTYFLSIVAIGLINILKTLFLIDF